MSTEPVPAAPVPTGPLRAELLRTASLRSARLDLVPLRVEHAGEMADVLSDPALHTFIGGSPATAQALRSRYARLVADSPDPSVVWCNWVLRRRRDPCLVGTVQATVTGGSLAEIAWVVGTPWQGRGYASEAASALVAGLRAHSVRTVVAHVHPDHLASAAVAAAAGLSPTDEEQDGEIRWRLSPTPDPDAVGPPHG
ncbi:GNAT family N-acetyltransferase [Streptomyces adustus]